MARAVIFLSFICAAAGAGTGEPYYFVSVHNGAYNFKGGRTYLEESYKVLEKMVELADSRHVRLTLFFSAQYAVYISSGPARLAALEKWKTSGHEIGAYHQGPDTKAWDGYSDLARGELRRLRGGKLPERVPGRGEFFSGLKRLAPEIKAGCMPGSADKDFLSAAPAYETCYGLETGGKAARNTAGVNEFLSPFLGRGGGKKRLSSSHPSDRGGIEAAKKDFSGMNGGLYGAAFKSSPSEFGAFYAWLNFLNGTDAQGLRSRTVSEAVEQGLLPENEAGGAVPEKIGIIPEISVPGAAEQTGIPRLKPVHSPFSQVERLFSGRSFRRVLIKKRGYCGDGLCEFRERKAGTSCARDCGAAGGVKK